MPGLPSRVRLLDSRPKIRPVWGVARGRRLRLATPALGSILAALVWAATSQASPSERIVSLAPSTTETLFAVGAGPEVVGVSQYCDYPPQVLKLPKVGSFLTPNLEAIVGLRPTMIVGLDNSANDREIRALERMGYQVVLVNDSSLEGIADGIGSIGMATGHGAQAHR